MNKPTSEPVPTSDQESELEIPLELTDQDLIAAFGQIPFDLNSLFEDEEVEDA